MSNELVKAGETGVQALSFDMANQFVTSLDLSTDAGRYNYVRATNGELDKLSDSIGQEIVVEDALAHEVQIVKDEDGEVVNAIRLVLFSPDGSAYQCVSKGAWDSLRRLCVLFGPLPWKGGRSLVVRQKNTGRGRRIFTFELPPIADKKTKKA